MLCMCSSVWLHSVLPTCLQTAEMLRLALAALTASALFSYACGDDNTHIDNNSKWTIVVTTSYPAGVDSRFINRAIPPGGSGARVICSHQSACQLMHVRAKANGTCTAELCAAPSLCKADKQFGARLQMWTPTSLSPNSIWMFKSKMHNFRITSRLTPTKA